MTIREDAGLPPENVVDYWVDLINDDLGTFSDVARVRYLIQGAYDADRLKYFTIDNTGIFAYVIVDDLKGGKCLCETMFYIRKEHRGNLRLVKRYIQRAEEIAMDTCCMCVKIGANIEYKDQSLIKLLKRWGYVDDTVSKQIRGN